MFVFYSSSADCKNNTVAEEQKQLAWLVMETLTVLLQGSNNTNAGKKQTHTHTHRKFCKIHNELTVRKVKKKKNDITAVVKFTMIQG